MQADVNANERFKVVVLGPCCNESQCGHATVSD